MSELVVIDSYMSDVYGFSRSVDQDISFGYITIVIYRLWFMDGNRKRNKLLPNKINFVRISPHSLPNVAGSLLNSCEVRTPVSLYQIYHGGILSK